MPTTSRTLALAAGLLVLAASLTVLPGAATGAGVAATAPQPARIAVSEGTAGIALVEESPDRLVFEVTVGELSAIDLDTKEGTFSRLLLPGQHLSHQIGEPELPMLNRLFHLPYGAVASVEVLGYETRRFDLAEYGIEHLLMPAQPSVFKDQDPADLPFHFDRATYERNEDFGLELARAVDTGRMRGVEIGRLEVAPVTYNPVTGTIVVKEHLRIAVELTGADLQRDAEIKRRTRSPFFEPLYESLPGYRSTHDDHPDLFDGPVTYVVVSHRMFESQLQPFIQWKTEQGFKVIVGYTDVIGSTTTAVRDYVHGLYETEDPAPTFVLFVGDIAQIPAYSLSGASDLPYCDLTGDDIPEMYYGRFSANNAGELQPQIDKTLEYEQHTFPDPSYLGEAVMIAGVDGTFGPTHGNGQINYGTIHYFNLAHGILSHTYLYPESGSSAAQIVQDVSNGCGVVNYTAHGSTTSWSNPSFTMANVSSLQNADEYCLAIGNCCLTSSFEVGTCFAEQWLRVADKGAIGYIGGSNSTLWDEDYYWSVGYGPVVGSGATYEQTGLGAYDGMFHDHGEAKTQWYIVQDAHVFCGNLAVQQSGSSYTDYYWEIYNLMGDPSLSVYLGVPTANPVVLPPNILPGATEVTVTAAPYSYVGFTAGGELVGCGMLDGSGTGEIPISGHDEAEYVHVVITCQNRIPYVIDVPVMTLEEPYLVVAGNEIDEVVGDGDGRLDAGESVELRTSLRNIGGNPATNVTGVLHGPLGFILTDDTETWGTILPDETRVCDDAFRFSLPPDLPDQTALDFTLNLTSDQDAWDRQFSFVVEAPVVELVSCTVDDASGDGDGMADPGETIGMTIRLRNTGHEIARTVTAVLTSSSPFVEIQEGTASIGMIPTGWQSDLTGYSLSISGSCPEMSAVELHLAVTADLGYEAEFLSDLPVAPFLDDCEADLGWTVSGTATTGAWERADPEGTTYNGNVVQPEDDHTPDPGTYCAVTGAAAGTAAGDNDVDGGDTILTSPVFDLSGLVSATVEYWRWYTNNLGNNPGEDWWTVQVSSDNGGSWVDLEHTQSSANEWGKQTFALEDYVELTDQIVFRFTAADEGSGSLVEAAMDDFMLYGVPESTTSIEEDGGSGPGFWLGQNSPNAAHPATEIHYRLDSPSPVRTTLRIYDATGRVVRTLVDDEQAIGEHTVTWDGRAEGGRTVASGVYFYVLTSGEKSQARKMIVVY